MLNTNYYTIQNALTWQIFAGHCEEAKTGSLGHRVVHGAAAAAQFLPILSQIFSLFELAIVKITEWANTAVRSLTGKIFYNSGPALDISKKTFKNDVEKSNALLFEFYKGTGKDIEGRTLSDIWKFNDYYKEKTHNYIQWLFPSLKGSAHNDRAPVLGGEKALVEKMRRDPVVIANLKKSFDVMLNFYALNYDAQNKKVVRNVDFDSRAKYWITSGNHNFLRITRILGCLVNFGLVVEAKAFLAQLKLIESANPAIVSSSYKHWTRVLAGL